MNSIGTLTLPIEAFSATIDVPAETWKFVANNIRRVRVSVLKKVCSVKTENGPVVNVVALIAIALSDPSSVAMTGGPVTA